MTYCFCFENEEKNEACQGRERKENGERSEPAASYAENEKEREGERERGKSASNPGGVCLLPPAPHLVVSSSLPLPYTHPDSVVGCEEVPQVPQVPWLGGVSRGTCLGAWCCHRVCCQFIAHPIA